MEATQETTAAAAGDLFEELASHCRHMGQLFHELVNQPESADAICMAGEALASKAGYVAQNAAQALLPGPGIQADAEWMLSPRGLTALATLNGARAEGGAA